MGGFWGFSQVNININDISVYELAPFATAVFDTAFETKIAKSKCHINNSMQVDLCRRTVNATSLVVDGSVVIWPTK